LGGSFSQKKDPQIIRSLETKSDKIEEDRFRETIRYSSQGRWQFKDHFKPLTAAATWKTGVISWNILIVISRKSFRLVGELIDLFDLVTNLKLPRISV
jgi:hypothetical protein